VKRYLTWAGIAILSGAVLAMMGWPTINLRDPVTLAILALPLILITLLFATGHGAP
jgi:hypothetical protein